MPRDAPDIISACGSRAPLPSPCAALRQAQRQGRSLGFGLLLWDGYRPQRAVDCFIRRSRQPEDGRRKPRHYSNIDRTEMFEQGDVAGKSGHSRGSIVDLTLYHLATGEIAPMGGDHDLMDPVSRHNALGITEVAAGNRQVPCSVMDENCLVRYDHEWWPYVDEMRYAYAAADFSLCRSGAMTCAELAAVGLPAAYVPLPLRGGGQRRNAEPVVTAGGALLVDDADLGPAWIATALIPVLTDPARIAAMSAHASAAGAPDADLVLAGHVLTVIAGRRAGAP